MRKHIVVRNGRLHFILPAQYMNEAAAKLGVSDNLFLKLYQSLKRGGGRYISRVNFSAEAEFESGRHCNGITKVERQWWGHNMWLNDCDTRAMIAVIEGAVKGATACAKIPPLTLMCSVLAGLGAAYAVFIDVMNKQGRSQGGIITWAGTDFPPTSTIIIPPYVRTQGPMVPLSDALNQAMAKIRQAAARP